MNLIPHMLALVVAAGGPPPPSAIFGEDDRREVDDPRNAPAMRRAAEGVAVLLPSTNVQRGADGYARLAGTDLADRWNLCPSEAFGRQPAPGNCTGFLVGPDLLVTAGHCVRSSTACNRTAFVFGFSAPRGRPEPQIVPNDDVYGCNALEARVVDDSTGVDFALVRLDRPAYARRLLPYRRTGTVARGSPVTALGHPAGLPLKITTGATVTSNGDSSGFFFTDLDGFSGSSGSPVINDRTGLVEGIVVRGPSDFDEGPDGCRVAVRCASIRECRGEEITRITAVLDYLP